MFNNYDDIIKLLDDRLDDIKRIARKKRLTYDEIKELLVKLLYDLSIAKKNDKVEEKVVTVEMPQVLYGPPPREEIHEVKYDEPEVKVVSSKMPQVLYGPPPREEIHEVKYDEPEVKVVSSKIPQVLYGPPPREEIHEMFVDFDVNKFEHSDELIPGTNVYKPRNREVYESDEEYVAYLDEYYSYYFPNSKKGGKAK